MPDDFDTVAEDGLEAVPEPEEPVTDDAGEEEGTEAEAAPEAPAGEEPAEKAAAEPEEPEEGAEPWRSSLRPGETPEQAIPRLVGHIQRYKGDLDRLERRIEEQAPKLSAAEKILERIQRREQLEELARREAELPDPELEPEKYNALEVRRLREAIERDRQERQEAEKRQLTEAEQREREQAIRRVDQQGEHQILSALGQVEGAEADPEFVDAFQYQEAVRWQAITSEYGDELGQLPPEEAQAKAVQAMNLMRSIDMRKAAAVGKPVTDLVLARYRAVPESVRQAMKAHLAASQAGGNGQKPKGKPGKPSAQEIERQASAAKRGAGVRRTTGSGGVAAPMNLDDFLGLSEHEQARLIEKGDLAEEELWAGLSDPDFG